MNRRQLLTFAANTFGVAALARLLPVSSAPATASEYTNSRGGVVAVNAFGYIVGEDYPETAVPLSVIRVLNPEKFVISDEELQRWQEYTKTLPKVTLTLGGYYDM